MDDLAVRAAANCASAYREWAARTGHPTALWADLSVGDMGVRNVAPIDSASLLAPVSSAAGLRDVVDRMEHFFAGRPGGPIQVWSAWPVPGLASRGYQGFRVPALVRPTGGEPPGLPDGLAVRPASSPDDFAAAGRIIDEVFDVGAPDPAALVAQSMVGPDCAVFVGWVEGQPVATATDFVSDGLCGVYAVATRAWARGRGYGEALSWAATMFRPDLPAALQASSMGLPVYLGMGYREFGHFDLWVGPRRRSA